MHHLPPMRDFSKSKTMKKYIVTMQAQKVRVDVSQNGQYSKDGHNEVKPSNNVFARTYDEPQKVGEIIYLHDCEEEPFGWDGRISYLYSCVVISCIEQNPVPFDLPDPPLFKDIQEDYAIWHMEACVRGGDFKEGSPEYYKELRKFPSLSGKVLWDELVEEQKKKLEQEGEEF